jgi:hypothetical protein
LNGDAHVNGFDFGLFVNFFSNGCSGCPADLDGNGSVNSFDPGLFANAYGEGC